MLSGFFVSLHACDQDDEDLDSLKKTFVAIRENISSPLELDISISDLPNELISHVLTYLSIPDFQQAQQVCQRWKSVLKEVYFLDRILDLIQQNQDKRKEFFIQGNPHQVLYCIFKDQKLMLDLKVCPLFSCLHRIVYANPALLPKFWAFACSKVLKFNYPLELPYQTVDTWLLHGKILSLLDPLDFSQRLGTALLTLRNFIKSDPYPSFKVRSRNLDLLRIYTLSTEEKDRQKLRKACNERIQESKEVKPHPLEEWLAQVEIQWRLLDAFKASAQAQLHEAAAIAPPTQPQ